MSVCKYCTGVGGFHKRHCPTRVRSSSAPKLTPKPREYRIEWFGSLQVHQPVKP